jgi:Glutathione S-transferase, N-terminal domain
MTSAPSGSAISACSGYPDELRTTARTEGYRRRVAIKLYRCKNLWVKAGGHPCWRVQSALDEQRIEYELVTGPWPAIGKRHNIEELSGQTKYPVIQFEDGSVYREESKDMADTIMAGKLFDKQGAQRPAS